MKARDYKILGPEAFIGSQQPELSNNLGCKIFYFKTPKPYLCTNAFHKPHIERPP